MFSPVVLLLALFLTMNELGFSTRGSRLALVNAAVAASLHRVDDDGLFRLDPR